MGLEIEQWVFFFLYFFLLKGIVCGHAQVGQRTLDPLKLMGWWEVGGSLHMGAKNAGPLLEQ